jgi:hypothetical protein
MKQYKSIFKEGFVRGEPDNILNAPKKLKEDFGPEQEFQDKLLSLIEEYSEILSMDQIQTILSDASNQPL